MAIVTPKLPKNKKDKQTILDKVEYIIELESKRQDEKAFLYILDNLLKPTDAAYKKIVKLINVSSPTIEEDKQSLNKKSIIFDVGAVEVILRCKELGRYQENIVKIFVEFQRSYRSGYYYEHPEKYKRNNEDVVDHFCKWCLSDKNKKSIPRSPETRTMMEILKNKLIAIYNDR